MNIQYVKITAPEKQYIQKNMLENELGLLSIMKIIRRYKELRKEELTLKVAVKTKLDEIMNMYKEIDQILPKMEISRKEIEDEFLELSEKKQEGSLEEEIEAIKRKLLSLK